MPFDVAVNAVTARSASARVVVFPELSLTGYEPAITVEDPGGGPRSPAGQIGEDVVRRDRPVLEAAEHGDQTERVVVAARTPDSLARSASRRPTPGNAMRR